jgi:arylsulfatase
MNNLSTARSRHALSPADITSNTFWDWQLNHVGQVYGMMQEVFAFASTFKDFPPRAFPPSFNPANIMEDVLKTLKAEKKLREAYPQLPAPASTP